MGRAAVFWCASGMSAAAAIMILGASAWHAPAPAAVQRCDRTTLAVHHIQSRTTAIVAKEMEVDAKLVAADVTICFAFRYACTGHESASYATWPEENKHHHHRCDSER